MKGTGWKDSLAKIDENISELKSVEKIVNKLEKASSKYGANVNLKRKMTLTNFDELRDDDEVEEKSSVKRYGSSLQVIQENPSQQAAAK